MIIYNDPDRGDFLAGYSTFGKYAQYIDGKTLTVLIHERITWEDTSLVSIRLIPIISRYIKVRSLGVNPSDFQTKVIRKTELYCEGKVIIDDIFSQKLKGKRDIYFFLTSNFIVINIRKIRAPYYGKTGFDAYKCIGGIDARAKGVFKRFGSDSFDFDKEFLKTFPWIPDSAEAWKEINSQYINGAIPLNRRHSITRDEYMKDLLESYKKE